MRLSFGRKNTPPLFAAEAVLPRFCHFSLSRAARLIVLRPPSPKNDCFASTEPKKETAEHHFVVRQSTSLRGRCLFGNVLTNRYNRGALHLEHFLRWYFAAAKKGNPFIWLSHRTQWRCCCDPNIATMRDIFSGERVLSGSQSTVARSVRPELNNNNNNFKISEEWQEAWG